MNKRHTWIAIALLALPLLLGACNHYQPWKDEYGQVHDQLQCVPYNYTSVSYSNKKKNKIGYSGLSGKHSTKAHYSNVSGTDCYYP